MPTAIQQPQSACQRRWDRGSWIAVGVVVVFFLWALPQAIMQLRMPTDGCIIDTVDFDTPNVLYCFATWDTPLRTDDVIVQVAGKGTAVDITNVELKPPPPGWLDGGVVRYEIQRAGQPLVLDVPLHTMSLADMARALGPWIWNNLVVDTLTMLLSIGIFALRPRSRAAQLLFAASTSGVLGQLMFSWTGSTIAGTYTNAPPAAWIAANIPQYGAGWLYVPALLLLVLSFPRPVWPVARWPRLAPALIFGVGFSLTLAWLATGNFAIFLIGLGSYSALLIVVFVATSIHTALRVRDPVVRAQAAWMGLGLALYCVSGLLWASFGVVPGGSALASEYRPVFNVTGIISGLALPTCLGIAITRYRLFDIEVIIRRTLVYSGLTLTLGLIYLGVIVVLQSLLVPLVGSSELAIVVSTLAIAALFFPLRRRIQSVIDRRFYRRKYDAAKVLAQFAATARDETDLARLTGELLRVVDTAVQPVSVGLWLKEAPEAQREAKGI